MLVVVIARTLVSLQYVNPEVAPNCRNVQPYTHDVEREYRGSHH